MKTEARARQLVLGGYQQLLHSLVSSGTFVAVASRNDPFLQEAFAQCDLILRADDIFPFDMHWARNQNLYRESSLSGTFLGTTSCVWTTAPWT